MTTATSTHAIGARIATRLHESLGPKRYAMWFDRSASFELDDHEHTLRVTVANKFLADGIGRQFRRQVCEAAQDELGYDVQLELGVHRAESAGAPHAEAPQSESPQEKPVKQARQSHRRWRYTLDDFVVGPSNQLAFAAAMQLAEQDDVIGSPLFIHGGCGLGKTHLLQGICERATARRPDFKIRYTTGEQFTNEYITAVRTNNLDAFRKKIRKLDLLAVDDVHFLADKEKTQQEFLHCFNEIELSGARLVLVSDCHPKEIKKFSDALTSRFVRGMVAEIQSPDTHTRLRLVEALAERRGLAVPESVASAISQRCGGSVRDIEGVLNKLQALTLLQRRNHRSTTGTPGLSPMIGHSLVDQLFQSQPDNSPRKPVRFNTILDTVCEMFALTQEQVTGRIRKTHIVLARSLLIHLAYEVTAMSYPEIAAAMGRPNHSTIVTAAQRIKKQLKQDGPVLLPGEPGETTPSRLLEQLRQTVMQKNKSISR